MPIFLPPTISGGASWSLSFSQTLDGTAQPGVENFSFRTVVPAASISTSGSTIRVTLGGDGSNTVQFDNVSIVERSGSTENGTTTPTELKFSGASGVTISGGGEATSDSLSFTLDETKDYLVICDVHSTNGYTDRKESGGPTYYKAATDSWNVQSPAGFSSAGSVSWNITKIEVLA